MKIVYRIGVMFFVFLLSNGTVQPMFSRGVSIQIKGGSKKSLTSMFGNLSFKSTPQTLSFWPKLQQSKKIFSKDYSKFPQFYRPNYAQRRWFSETNDGDSIDLLSDDVTLKKEQVLDFSQQVDCLEQQLQHEIEQPYEQQKIEESFDKHTLQNIELYELQCRLADQLNCSMLDAGNMIVELGMVNEWIEVDWRTMNLPQDIKDIFNEWAAEKVEKKFKYLNTQDENGETPLLYVVRIKNYSAVRVFLKLGVDPNIPDFKGKTPFSVAQEYNDKYLIDKLLEYGATPDVAY